jgi:hypothetical protein
MDHFICSTWVALSCLGVSVPYYLPASQVLGHDPFPPFRHGWGLVKETLEPTLLECIQFDKNLPLIPSLRSILLGYPALKLDHVYTRRQPREEDLKERPEVRPPSGTIERQISSQHLLSNLQTSLLILETIGKGKVLSIEIKSSTFFRRRRRKEGCLLHYLSKEQELAYLVHIGLFLQTYTRLSLVAVTRTPMFFYPELYLLKWCLITL